MPGTDCALPCAWRRRAHASRHRCRCSRPRPTSGWSDEPTRHVSVGGWSGVELPVEVNLRRQEAQCGPGRPPISGREPEATGRAGPERTAGSSARSAKRSPASTSTLASNLPSRHTWSANTSGPTSRMDSKRRGQHSPPPAWILKLISVNIVSAAGVAASSGPQAYTQASLGARYRSTRPRKARTSSRVAGNVPVPTRRCAHARAARSRPTGTRSSPCTLAAVLGPGVGIILSP